MFWKFICQWKEEPAVRHLWDVMICGSRRITGSWILWAPMNGIWWHLHVWSSIIFLVRFLSKAAAANHLFLWFIVYSTCHVFSKTDLNDKQTRSTMKDKEDREWLLMGSHLWTHRSSLLSFNNVLIINCQRLYLSHNVDWEFGKTYNRLYEKEKMKWEGEFTLRSDPWAGLIASCGSFLPKFSGSCVHNLQTISSSISF